MSLPSPKRSRWYATDLATTLFAAVPTVLAGAAGIAKGWHEDAPGVVKLAIAMLFATLVGVLFKALQSRRKDVRDAAKRSPSDLEAGLYTLHSAVMALRGLPHDEHAIAKLRVTIFRVVETDDMVEQIVPFVGGAGGGEGTRWSARSGVIGRAVLQGQVGAMIRDGSFDAYVKTLVESYAMHQREARALPDDRYAFLAVPLRWRSGPVIGVIYLDSTDATLFSNPSSPKADISRAFVLKVVTACAGLGLYTELRYAMEARR